MLRPRGSALPVVFDVVGGKLETKGWRIQAGVAREATFNMFSTATNGTLAFLDYIRDQRICIFFCGDLHRLPYLSRGCPFCWDHDDMEGLFR
jgi:hypothetical protein